MLKGWLKVGKEQRNGCWGRATIYRSDGRFCITQAVAPEAAGPVRRLPRAGGRSGHARPRHSLAGKAHARESGLGDGALLRVARDTGPGCAYLAMRQARPQG